MNQFDWDFPAADEGKLKMAKKAWLRIDLARVPVAVFEHAVKLIGIRFKRIPSLKDFLDLCVPTPEMFGLPSLDAALQEATRNAHPAMLDGAQWSHQAVYHAAAESGFGNLRSLPADAVRKLFDRNYTMAIRAVMEGAELRRMPKALPSSVPSHSTPEVGRSALAALRAARGSKS
ncbi:Replication protein P [Pseudomonas sp. R5(2019)]|uniref:Replication protein P n=1 Tax=Pseudomonas sp. R5(2019) TaxID=2697566 RepID=UPI001412AD0B|nr:Replication protein P [Pseudomonas sp. R5(2019)]NBA95528.1 Replication protein P [Pseudomonas sp. R5(2019)]